MMNPSAAYLAANAKLQKKPVWVMEIQEYSRIFSNVQALAGIAGAWLTPSIALGLQTVNFNVPFSVNGTLSGYALPAGVSPSAVTKVEAIIVASHVGGAINGLFGFQLSINSLLFFNDPITATALGSWSYDITCSPTGTYIDPTTFPFSTVSFVASLGANLINTYNDSASAGCILLVTYGPDSKQVLLLPTSFAPYNPSGAFGTGTVGFPGPAAGSIALSPWLVSVDDLKLTVSDLDGGSDLSNLVFNVQDHAQLITSDLAGFVFEGKECRFYEGFDGMARSDFLLRYRGVINTVDADNGNLEYKFTVSSFNLKKLTAAIFATGDDGFATDSKHPKTLNGHPLDMLVDALTQAGVAGSDIDTAKIHYYRDTIFNGLSYVFNLTKAPVAKDFIENELMKPLGMYLWENSAGLVSLNSFYPAISGSGAYTPPTPPVMTLTVADITDVPLPVEADLIDQVIMRFDDDGTGSTKFLAENISTYAAAIAKYGLTDGHIIESQGMRSGFLGYFMAAIISRLIFLRYGLKNLTFDPMPALWDASVLDPGDIIAVTMPYVADRAAGVLGITTQTFEVMDRNWKFMDGTVELKLLALDISAFKQFLITPNGEADYTAASSTDKAKYMFQCDPITDKYSNGDPANTLG
jgi:hypothetical protein